MVATLNETPLFIMNRVNTASTGTSVHLDRTKRYKVSGKFNVGFSQDTAVVYIRGGPSEGGEVTNIAKFDFLAGDESAVTPELDPEYSYINAEIDSISSANSSVTIVIHPVQ